MQEIMNRDGVRIIKGTNEKGPYYNTEVTADIEVSGHKDYIIHIQCLEIERLLEELGTYHSDSIQY